MLLVAHIKEYFMNEFGIIKKIDSLGRMVIPKEIRKLFGLESEAEILITKEGVLVRKPIKQDKKAD